MTIYEKPGYVTITHHGDKNYVLFDWTNATISFSDIKEAHLKAFEVDKEKGVKTLVADCSKMKYSFTTEITDWFATEMMPRLSKEAGIQRIITILDNSAIAKLNAKSWQKANDIDLPNVSSMNEALDLVI